MERKIYVPKNSSRHSEEEREIPRKQNNVKKMKVVSNINTHGNSHEKGSNPKSKNLNSRIEPHLHTLQRYSNYNWEELDINELYAEFKQIEKHLKEMLETDYKQCLHVVSDYNSLKEYFLNVWERILFKDVGFACAKEIDKRLGAILKRPIEVLNKEKKKDEESREKLFKLIEGNIEILKNIIQSASTKLDIQNTAITEDNVRRKIVSNLISYLGELFQIREKVESQRPTLKVPVELYFRATSIYPFEGKYFSLVSNSSKIKDDLFGAIYWGVRAYCCNSYYPMNEQLLKYLEEARLAYLEMLEREWLDVRNVELFKYFVLSFLRYLNIILTKIGFEELNSVTNKMFEYLQKYTSYLVNEDSHISKPTEGSLLQQAIMLVIYSLQNAIYGYHPRDEIKENYHETQGKSFVALASNDLAKECLKDSYGVIFHIIELIIKVPDENYLNALSPFLYYLVGHKSVADYLLATYKQLKDKLLTLNKKLNTIYKKKCEEMGTTDEEIKTLLDEHFFPSDKLLFGFVPLTPYFDKEKTPHKRPLVSDKQYLVKIKDTICNLDFLGCRVVEKNGSTIDEKPASDIFNLEGIIDAKSDAAVDKHITAFKEMAYNKENKEKNLIVVDGQNVAIRHGDTKFSSMGLKIAIDFWVEKGHQVNVFLPDYYFKKEEVAMKRQLAQSKGESLKHIPDNVDILLELKAKGYAFGIPNWNYDDSYMIDYAKKKNAFIVTNDRYNDHIKNYSKNDPQMKDKLRDWIRNNCISFTFIGDDFMPNPDFLLEHMK